MLRLEPLLIRYRGSIPPHFIKQRIIRDYARRFALRTLVETGTYEGDLVWAMRGEFDEIFSIELDADLHAKALERFKGRPHVHLYQGDSAKILGNVIPLLRGPALFWLDGHYSGGVTAKGETETPVLVEIDHILRGSGREHVILIDDARCFGHGDYPSIDEVRRLIGNRPKLSFEVIDDIIRITPF